MSAPNRLSVLEQIWAEYPPSGPFANDDERRVYLLEVYLPRLQGKETQGEWGYLIKTEREPDFIPSDIAVWKATREHFDVLIGTPESGPCWHAHGVMENPAWEFGAVVPITDGSPSPLPPLGSNRDDSAKLDEILANQHRFQETQARDTAMIIARDDLNTQRILDRIEQVVENAEASGKKILALWLASQRPPTGGEGEPPPAGELPDGAGLLLLVLKALSNRPTA